MENPTATSVTGPTAYRRAIPLPQKNQLKRTTVRDYSPKLRKLLQYCEFATSLNAAMDRFVREQHNRLIQKIMTSL